ncbi:MAG: DNA-processing protein DprA [Oscillospiraceae bacterium]|jgi:DNA processing protein|nr:DNA-processing protein DprA [Oscillospiraceae bacterium]
MPELIYWLWLSQIQSVGASKCVKYIEHFRDIRKLYDADKHALYEVPKHLPNEVSALMNKNLDTAKAIYEKCISGKINIIPLNSKHYPERLASIYDPPTVLFVKGNLPDIDNECIAAIVGTRKAGQYGLTLSERLGFEVAECGGIVTSGLADGIDGAAVKGALRAEGTPIGVLGTGIDIIFPNTNERLFRETEARGALISEYPPGFPASRHTFPARNRIISGISLSVIIIEAPFKSGSLITAAHAREQGREVLVIPGNVDMPSFEGSNELLRDGAELITQGWDAVGRHAWRFPSGKLGRKKNVRQIINAAPGESAIRGKVPVPAVKRAEEPAKPVPLKVPEKARARISAFPVFEGDEEHVYSCLEGTMSADVITARSELTPNQVMVALTMLELKGLVKNLGGMNYEKL